MPDPTPDSVGIYPLETPTISEGDTLHFRQDATLTGDGVLEVELGLRDVWVERVDGALEHYPDA